MTPEERIKQLEYELAILKAEQHRKIETEQFKVLYHEFHRGRKQLSMENKTEDAINLEFRGSWSFYWLYPPINEHDPKKKQYLEIGLCHVRAADNLRIHYDGERDGWSIEQASTFQWEPDDKICDPDWQEVAFIQAWGREKEHNPQTGLISKVSIQKPF